MRQQSMDGLRCPWSQEGDSDNRSSNAIFQDQAATAGNKVIKTGSPALQGTKASLNKSMVSDPIEIPVRVDYKSQPTIFRSKCFLRTPPGEAGGK